MISNTKPSTYGYAGDAYWPVTGTVPKSVVPTKDKEGVTYGVVGEAVNDWIQIEDSAAPGVDPVQAILLGLDSPGYFIYNPTTGVIAEVIAVDKGAWRRVDTVLMVQLDRTIVMAPGTAFLVTRPNAMSMSLLNEGLVNVTINGVTTAPGAGYSASGFRETGQMSRAVTPVIYDASAGGAILKISVNP